MNTFLSQEYHISTSLAVLFNDTTVSLCYWTDIEFIKNSVDTTLWLLSLLISESFYNILAIAFRVSEQKFHHRIWPSDLVMKLRYTHFYNGIFISCFHKKCKKNLNCLHQFHVSNPQSTLWLCWVYWYWAGCGFRSLRVVALPDSRVKVKYEPVWRW